MSKYTLVGGQVLNNIHEFESCKGRTCSIHTRTDHPMIKFPQNFRPDRGIIERICPHGVGHPDPDDRPFWAGNGLLDVFMIHGCDGCCTDSYL